MGIKVSILLGNELARRHKRDLVAVAKSHGHLIVERSDAELIVSDRPLASSAFLTINVAAEGEEEVPRLVGRAKLLLEQLGAKEAPPSPLTSHPPLHRPATPASAILKLGDGEIDRERGVFSRRGKESRLTATELSLLERLHTARGGFVSRRTLEREVWGYAESAQSRTVLSTIHRLRQKVELDPANPVLVLSDRQRGYRLSWDDGVVRRQGRELVGRDALVRDLLERLEGSAKQHVLVLTGPSGIGKTHLAQHLALTLGRRRALWCECSGLRQPLELLTALSRILDCRVEGPQPLMTLGHALAARDDLVLFLDDLDLTRSEMCEAIEALSEQSRRTRIVISCSTPGTLRATRVEVPPLGNEAARAMVVSRLEHLELRDEPQLQQVDRLVALCQGSPLLLELAVREARAALENTAVGTDWVEATWHSLTDEEKSLLGALSLLPGGFFFDAVETLAPAPERAFPLFTELVRRSLIVHLGPERYTQAEVEPQGSLESRFAVLSHIRALALEHQRPAAIVAARWLAERSERWARGLGGDGDAFGEAMLGFGCDETSLGFATRWAVSFDPKSAERLALALGDYLIMRGPLSEVLELSRMVRKAIDTPRLRFLEARVSTFMGQPGPAIALLNGLVDGDELAEPMARARVYDTLASLLPAGPERERHLARAADLFGDSDLGIAERFETEASTLWANGEVERALLATEKALAHSERVGCWRRTIALRINRGSHLRDLGRLPEARLVLDAARDDVESRGYGMALRYVELNLAFLAADETILLENLKHPKDEGRAHEPQERFGRLAIAARRHGNLALAARARVWKALFSPDPMGRRAELEVALGFALEVDDVEAAATAAAALSRNGRTAASHEPRLESLIARLPEVMRRPVLRLAGHLAGDRTEWPTTYWRAACWLADQLG